MPRARNENSTVSAEALAVEQALIQQWANFGQSAGGSFHEDGELIWTEAPVTQLPYNAVLQTRLPAGGADRIPAVIQRFLERDVQFLWIAHPSARPGNLEELMRQNGLSLIATETGMILDDPQEQVPARDSAADDPICCRQILDAQELPYFEKLILDYWGLPSEIGPYVHAFTLEAFESGDRGAWFLAWHEGDVVGKTYLSLRGNDETASLWGVYVKPTARGMGVATKLTFRAIRHALECGKRRIALISTDMGRGVYRRMGFREVCTIPVYANTRTLTALQGSVQPV